MSVEYGNQNGAIVTLAYKIQMHTRVCYSNSAKSGVGTDDFEGKEGCQ